MSKLEFQQTRFIADSMCLPRTVKGHKAPHSGQPLADLKCLYKPIISTLQCVRHVGNRSLISRQTSAYALLGLFFSTVTPNHELRRSGCSWSSSIRSQLVTRHNRLFNDMLRPLALYLAYLCPCSYCCCLFRLVRLGHLCRHPCCCFHPQHHPLRPV
jgi:hypothetical protein